MTSPKTTFALALCLLAMGLASPNASAVDVDAYLRKDRFEDIKISPLGDYFAATVPLDDRTVLAVMRRSDSKVTATFALGKNTHVSDFHWVNNERLLISIAEKYGELDQPQGTGELYAINVDGSKVENLVGYRVPEANTSSNIRGKAAEALSADLVDDLPMDERTVLVAITPFSADPYTRLEKMDVYTGKRVPVARAPVQRATFTTDAKGVARFVRGASPENYSQLYYRADETVPWQLINDEAKTARIEWPMGLSADGSTAYLGVEQESGPDVVIALDVASGKRDELLRDDDTDPGTVIYKDNSNTPIGIRYLDGVPRNAFFDETTPQARLQRSLESAFMGQAVTITSRTTDGKLALVQVWSDRNPGDFYVFDTVSKKAEFLLSRRDWLDPEKMAVTRPIAVVARDGMKLQGYLTVPVGASEKNLPLVVNPHGGPFGIRDVWGFDSEVQMLANAGYAVLQLNFRGSGGYGRAFTLAGAQQWGGQMQDDLTDATGWAIHQGVADPSRICIYGASYGGYAALMGVAKEPALYKCAVGAYGVYDLPVTHATDSRRLKRTASWMNQWLGERESLAAVSPNRIAGKIQVPVFLAAGGEDEVVPIKHSHLMESALVNAGVPVETLYFDTEGHGFYLPEHRLQYSTRLLAFLNRYLGGGLATAPAKAEGGK